ncbi:putative protein phosphatase 2C 57 [Dendrobium catenatum]|uniref:protein-serine/threonine phosphatase n=1 Tax=Dendrobium catenatum TaxID=906689 RepID=A0A2I0VVF5_9ASPA|nr:putative protein phosphatase 2C 57 [Dendrobium catenatum]
MRNGESEAQRVGKKGTYHPVFKLESIVGRMSGRGSASAGVRLRVGENRSRLSEGFRVKIISNKPLTFDSLSIVVVFEFRLEVLQFSLVIVSRSLVVANAGDCRAVLSRRGKAIEMSSDHKPSCMGERKRIEATGGFVYDGYLNGQLNVARALGDWHMEGMKVADGLGPLSAEPEVRKMKLTEEDEFLIIGCDGIWDVFRSQNAVDFARRKLQEHNDPATCCKDLVDEALKRKSGDNLSVVVVCFNSIPPPALAAPRPRVQRSISAEGLKELQSFLNSLGN